MSNGLGSGWIDNFWQFLFHTKLKFPFPFSVQASIDHYYGIILYEVFIWARLVEKSEELIWARGVRPNNDYSKMTTVKNDYSNNGYDKNDYCQKWL
jgi:hypothetical protein